ncbi:hypothetical protein B0H67DRAFT_646944 [Lasiosphaeris hirsuta]|uniref:RNase MRP protein 1 RNA binding domain-containing protein n=1 Tax=Lasiosphaeris hirsuta TaxID=260670 RepID=A0AA40A945_9PEZI|nr:hypothetical protein B0H67DRAFT_646944 [Lasiosphaeris hirsuta]
MTSPAAADPALLAAALASLTPALEILARFHHRNKNQHRLSRWWAHADMLRRQARKLEGAAGARLGEMESLRRKKPRRKADADGDEDEDEIAARARHLRDRVIPGAYLAFTQLTADRQFAHLGLMLLGVLAQVDRAISPFAAGPEEAEEEEAGVVVPRTASPAAAVPAHDTGVAVSRDAVVFLASEPTLRPKTETPKPRPEDEGRETAEQEPAPAIPRPKKKKKATAGGDEFDDIFGALEPAARKSKKKRKKGDEFDDIFGAL